MQPSIVGGAGLSPSPYRWSAASSAASTQKIQRVLATPIGRVPITPLKTSSVLAAAYPPARVVAAGNSGYGNDHSYRKPSCSYTCLIAMALIASPKESLQAGEIYKYIEQAYPYYQNLSKNNWKNSIRHSLSLGHYFRKVQNASGYPGRKGCFWEFVPEKKSNIVAEVEIFLQQERRSLMNSKKAVSANLASSVSMTQYMGAHSLSPCSPTTFNRLRQVQLQPKTPEPPPAELKTVEFQYTSRSTMATVSELPEANSIMDLCCSDTLSVPAVLPQPESIYTSTTCQDKDKSLADGTQLVCTLTTTGKVDVNKISTSKSDEVDIFGGNPQSSEEPDYQSLYRDVELQERMSRKRCLDTGSAQPSNETKQIKLSTSESSLLCNASRKRYLDSTEDDTTANISKRLKLTTGHPPSTDVSEELNPMIGFLQEPEKMAMENYRRSEGFRWLLAFQDELLKDLDSCLPSLKQSSCNTDVNASTNHDCDNVIEKISNVLPEEALILQKTSMSPGAATADNYDQELNKIGSTGLAVKTTVDEDELLATANDQGKEPLTTSKKENTCNHRDGESHVTRDGGCFEIFISLSGKTYPFAIYNDNTSTILEQATGDKPAVRLSVKGYSLKPDATEIDLLVATVHQDSDKLLSMSAKPIQTSIFPGPNVTASILATTSELSGNYEFWLAVKQHNSGCQCKQMCLQMGQKQIEVGPWILHPPAVSCENWPEVIWNSQWGVKSFVS